jgi:rhamnosyltransferase
MKVLVVIPVFYPGGIWLDCVLAIKTQVFQPDEVLIINSGASDSVVELASAEGFHIVDIDKASFNHGGTRQFAIDIRPGFDLVVFLTQDAVLANTEALNNILEGFQDKNVAAICGRQLPRPGAGPIETHARLYNYPDVSTVRSLTDASLYGLKTAFMSNSFAAYRIAALMDVCGFPDNVIFGEDMFIAAKLLMAGYKISYSANACVYHSHDYSLCQEFSRYFDMGVFHSREPWLREQFGSAEGAGIKYLASELKYLAKYGLWKIPEAFLRTVFRYAGFRIGLMEKHIPMNIKKKFCMNKGYFN